MEDSKYHEHALAISRKLERRKNEKDAQRN